MFCSFAFLKKRRTIPKQTERCTQAEIPPFTAHIHTQKERYGNGERGSDVNMCGVKYKRLELPFSRGIH